MGGYCPASDAEDCSRIVRDELTDGRDDPTSTVYTPNQLSSVTHRLAMALNVEYELDMADTVNDWDWDLYCSPDPDYGTAIHWSNVVIAGHSFGGNQATYISYRNTTQGAFIADSGYDTCEAVAPTSNPESIDVYDDDYSDYNTTGEPALWYDTFSDATEDGRVFAIHETDIFPTVVWPKLPPSLVYLAPSAIDDTTWLPLYGKLYDIDTGGGWSGQPFLSTSQAAAGTCPGPDFYEHLSMAIDDCMPNSSGGWANPAIIPGTSTLNVFDAYVDALCALEP